MMLGDLGGLDGITHVLVRQRQESQAQRAGVRKT